MSVQPCWIEVRPLSSGKFEAGCFSSTLEYLYNVGRPFRFYAVNCPSARVEGLRTVRLFLQVQGVELAERLANALKSAMDVEVIIGSEPPRKVYPVCADFALKGYSAQPVCPPKQKPEVNPLDVIMGTLSEADSALEVLAVQDRKGKLDVQKYLARKLGKSISFVDVLLDQAVGIGNAIAGAPPPKTKAVSPEIDPITKARVDAAVWKGTQNLFRCEIKAYGDAKTVEAIGEALPSSTLNRFKIAKRHRAVEAPPKELGKPKGRGLKASLLKYTAAVPWLLFLFAWLFLGAIDPPRLANVALFAIALAVASSLTLWLVFRTPEPLILCTGELSLIVGIPTAVGRLPVETGTARITREQLTFTAPPFPQTAPAVKPVVDRQVRVAGVLKDETTGEPLPNWEFEVYDEKGNRVYAGKTDEKGAFEIAVAAEKPESLKLEIKPKVQAENAPPN